MAEELSLARSLCAARGLAAAAEATEAAAKAEARTAEACGGGRAGTARAAMSAAAASGRAAWSAAGGGRAGRHKSLVRRMAEELSLARSLCAAWELAAAAEAATAVVAKEAAAVEAAAVEAAAAAAVVGKVQGEVGTAMGGRRQWSRAGRGYVAQARDHKSPTAYACKIIARSTPSSCVCTPRLRGAWSMAREAHSRTATG